jgi:hypothetical protein
MPQSHSTLGAQAIARFAAAVRLGGLQRVSLPTTHTTFGLSTKALRQASRILGDEFSAMGTAVALGLPRLQIAQMLATMCEQGWICPLEANRDRAASHGPWYGPRPPWERLRALNAAETGLRQRLRQAQQDVLRTVRASNRAALQDAPLVLALWHIVAADGVADVRPVRLELAVHLSPHAHGDRPAPAAMGHALRMLGETSPLLAFSDFHASIAAGARLRPLYRVSHDPGLWFDATLAVLAFPQDYLDCAQAWALRPGAYRVVLAHAGAGDVERAAALARSQLARRDAVCQRPGPPSRRSARQRSAFDAVAQQLLCDFGA